MPSSELADETNDESQKAETEAKGSRKTTRLAKPSRFNPTILTTESEKQVNAIRDELTKEIKPNGFIERMYVDDMADIIWEIQRLRRFKNCLIRNAMQLAIQNILTQVLASSDILENSQRGQLAKRMAAGWLNNQKDQAKIENTLTQFDLNENHIEAEAWRIASDDLDRIERMLTSLDYRRDKALFTIGKYRNSLAVQLNQTTQRMIEAEAVFDG
jgi:hypothetical protein